MLMIIISKACGIIYKLPLKCRDLVENSMRSPSKLKKLDIKFSKIIYLALRLYIRNSKKVKSSMMILVLISSLLVLVIMGKSTAMVILMHKGIELKNRKYIVILIKEPHKTTEIEKLLDKKGIKYSSFNFSYTYLSTDGKRYVQVPGYFLKKNYIRNLFKFETDLDHKKLPIGSYLARYLKIDNGSEVLVDEELFLARIYNTDTFLDFGIILLNSSDLNLSATYSLIMILPTNASLENILKLDSKLTISGTRINLRDFFFSIYQLADKLMSIWLIITSLLALSSSYILSYKEMLFLKERILILTEIGVSKEKIFLLVLTFSVLEALTSSLLGISIGIIAFHFLSWLVGWVLNSPTITPELTVYDVLLDLSITSIPAIFGYMYRGVFYS